MRKTDLAMKAFVSQILLVGIILIMQQACVPPKLYTEIETEKNNCKNESEGLIADNEKLTVENTELKANLDLIKENIQRMEESGLGNTEELNALKSRYDQLDKRYDELQQSHQTLISGSDSEARSLMDKLENTQRDLYQREDQLNQTEAKLENDRAELERLKAVLDQQNANMKELQKIIDLKDAQAEALKQKLSTALIGFENQGLTITKKNGKVYVSLDEKLLFSSGSTVVDVRGKSALHKLASVLEQNRDINITIEGHTDDVPIISGSNYADNWDLSVQRATAIIRILLDGTSINPKRLTAAGRGEFYPVDTRKTADARQKNRRTEIILEPNLDELFNLIDK
jgi:chemotaxis protein MotB